MSWKTTTVSANERWTRRFTLALTIGTGGAAWIGATAWVLHQQRRLNDIGPTDPCPVLVLGCRPGPALDARVAAAVELYHRGLADRLIISGRGECRAGAEAALRWGVPGAAVTQETDARNTWENLSKSARFLPDDRVWIATDRWHLPRALWFAGRLGLEAYPRPVDRAQRRPPVAFAREGMSVLYGLVRQGRDAVTG